MDLEVEFVWVIFTQFGKRVETALTDQRQAFDARLTSTTLKSCDPIPLVIASKASGHDPGSSEPNMLVMTAPTVCLMIWSLSCRPARIVDLTYPIALASASSVDGPVL